MVSRLITLFRQTVPRARLRLGVRSSSNVTGRRYRRYCQLLGQLGATFAISGLSASLTVHSHRPEQSMLRMLPDGKQVVSSRLIVRST